MLNQNLTCENFEETVNPVTELIETLSKGVSPFSITIRLRSEAKVLKIYKENLFIGLKNGEIMIYDIPNDQTIQKFLTNETSLLGMSIDPINSEIISIGKSSSVEFWTYEGLFLRSLETPHKCTLSNILFTCNTLFISDIEGHLSSYSCSSFKLIKAHDSKITCLDNNHEIIASSSHDCNIKIWDLSLNLLGKLTSPKIIHRLCFVSGSKIASAGSRSYFCVWNLRTFTIEREILSEENWVRSITGTFCENYIISGTNDSCVRYWNLNEPNNESYESFVAHESAVTNILSNESGSVIITGSKDRTVKIWQTCREIAKRKPLQGHSDVVICLLLTHDERFLYSGSADCSVCKWDINENALVARMTQHSMPVLCLVWHFEKLISGSEDKTLIIWKNDDLEARLAFTEYIISICSCEKFIFVGGQTGKIFVLNENFQNVTVLTGHLNSVSALVHRNNSLYSGSSDKFIKVWDTRTFQLDLSFKAHDSSIKKILLLPEENIIVSVSCDRAVKVWFLGEKPISLTLKEHSSAVSSICLNSNGWYFYTGDKKGKIIPWCSKEFVGMTTINIGEIILDMVSFKFEPLIAVAADKKIFLLNDEFSENHLMTVPNNQSYLFFLYISCLLKGKSMPLKILLKDYTILPFRLNLLHIFAYTNDVIGLKEALKAKVRFFSSEGENPVKIALNRKSYQCLDVFLKYIPIYAQFNPYIYKIIENEITEIFSINLKNLPFFLQHSFPVSKSKDLPKFGNTKCSKIIASETINVKSEDFHLNIGGKDAIEFRVSIFKMPLEIGSKDCINLLENLLECDIPEVFDQQITQTILQYLMAKSYKFMVLLSLVNFLSIMLLLIYSFYLTNSTFCGVMILALNFLFVIQEILEITNNFEMYVQDFWNIIDGIRMFGSIIAVSLILLKVDIMITRNVLSFAILFSMIRMISLFRLFNNTRYMIRTIFEILKDIASFLLILLMTTVTITISFYFAFNKSRDFTAIFLDAYLLNFGQINPSSYDDDWYIESLFLFSLFINPLVMMNLLIATMGDTFSRIQSSLIISNYKEIISLILEASTILIWKRNQNNKYFLQACYKKNNSSFIENIPAKLKKIKTDIELLKDINLKSGKKIDQISKFFETIQINYK